MFGRRRYTVARQFVEAINARDLVALREIIGDDCRIVDPRGDWMEGRDTCLEGLARFFAIEPEYRIHVESIGRNGDNVLITGRTTARDPRFAVSTLWRARSDGRHLREWQSYARSHDLAGLRVLVGDKVNKGPYVEGAD